MLKDQVTVKFKAGNGGGGAVKFAGGTNKYPTGGDGGKGGDVYLEGTTDLYDLGFINLKIRVSAFQVFCSLIFCTAMGACLAQMGMPSSTMWAWPR